MQADAATLRKHETYLPEQNRAGVTLCLSGGGFRAALFHLGALTRLNQLGVLSQVDTVSCVSGGSIVGAFLASRLQPWPTIGARAVVADAIWHEQVVDPIRSFTKHDLRTGPVLRRLRPQNWFRPSAAVLGLRDHYYKGITKLARSDLPLRPQFLFCATELVYGVDFIFERGNAGSHQRNFFDDRAGGWEVARAVAASSCFPPIFQPLPVRLEADSPLRALDENTRVGSKVHLELSDGGVYDNLGLEPVWKSSRVLLVSDGGAPFMASRDHGFLWRLKRWADIGSHAGGSLRKRWLISNYKTAVLEGAYWGVGSAVGHYPGKPDGYPLALVRERIANMRTDLDVFSDAEAEVLQNHGYFLADAAVRAHSPKLAISSSAFTLPYPEWGPTHENEIRSALRKSNQRSLLGHEPWWKLPEKVIKG